jgi:hypothetical protein
VRAPSSIGVAGGFIASAALLGTLLGCSAPPDAPPPDASVAGDPTIVFRDGELELDGRRIDFPTTAEQLAAVLGPYVRVSDGYGEKCGWDALGLEAREDEPAGRIRSVTLRCCGDGAAAADSAPAACFRGRVVLPSGSFDGASTPAELEALGLVAPKDGWGDAPLYGGRLGRSWVIVTRSAGTTKIGLNWSGTMVHQARTGESDGPPLFTIRAREHGCDFDEDLVELSRDGNVSIVRLDSYGNRSKGSVGRSMFVMGAIGALAIERGYQYAVMLEPLGRRGEAPAGGGSYWHAIGFTDEATPDVAREFPGRAGQLGDDKVISRDWALVMLADWPELASGD